MTVTTYDSEYIQNQEKVDTYDNRLSYLTRKSVNENFTRYRSDAVTVWWDYQTHLLQSFSWA